MDIKLKKVSNKFLLIIFVFISIDSYANINLPIKTISSEGAPAVFEQTPDPIILYNAYVIKDSENVIQTSSTIKKLGKYKYSISSSNEGSSLESLKAIAAENGLLDSSQRSLNLIQDISGRYMIIESSIVVQFKEFPDLTSFANQYNIDLEQDFSNINSAVFNVRDIKKILQMLNTLRQDPRVKGASFDAIDPLIKPQ